jgi:hypothetical protein
MMVRFKHFGKLTKLPSVSKVSRHACEICVIYCYIALLKTICKFHRLVRKLLTHPVYYRKMIYRIVIGCEWAVKVDIRVQRAGDLVS